LVENLIESSNEKKLENENLGVSAGDDSCRSRGAGSNVDDELNMSPGKKNRNKVGHFGTHSREKLIVSLL
jgi:hypothetical protein